jgi:hypothetical protein
VAYPTPEGSHWTLGFAAIYLRQNPNVRRNVHQGVGSQFHELLDEELNGTRLQDVATKLSELIVDADKLM